MPDCEHDWEYKAVIPTPRADGAKVQHRKCRKCRKSQVVPVCVEGKGADECKDPNCPSKCAERVSFYTSTRLERR